MKYLPKKLVSYVLSGIGILIALGFVSVPAYAQTISLDNPWYYYDHPAQINFTDIANPGLIGLQARLDAATAGAIHDSLTVDLIEKTPGSGKYLSEYIFFSPNPPAGSTNVLKAFVGDTISATLLPGGPTTPAPNPQLLTEEDGVVPASPTQTERIIKTSVKTKCGNHGGDVDQDFICDNWENAAVSGFNGLKIPYLTATGLKDVGTNKGNWTLPCGGAADPICPGIDKRDIYVEVDYLKGHKPNQTAINDVKTAFDKMGIRLHVQVDQEIPIHSDLLDTYIPGAASVTEYDKLKQNYFGTVNDQIITPGWPYQENLTSKRQAFHYALFIHKQEATPTSSGFAEIPGNDFVLSLGAFTGAVGSGDQQEGTFMHELGHNLGLYHGGAYPSLNPSDDTYDNCKPNYLSVMSYSRQFSDFISDRPLNYSQSKLNDLNENGALNEGVGVSPSTPPGQRIVYGVTEPSRIINVTEVADGTHVDWNGDNNIPPPEQTSVLANINNLGILGCNLDASDSNAKVTLAGYNDSQNLNLRMNGTSAFSDGKKSQLTSGAWIEVTDWQIDDKPNIYYAILEENPTTDDTNGIEQIMHLYVPFDIPKEITMDSVRQMRLERNYALSYVISTLPDKAFVHLGDTTTLQGEINQAAKFIAQDTLYHTIKKYRDIRAQTDGYYGGSTKDDLITQDYQKKILDILDDMISSLEIEAQASYSNHPYTLSPCKSGLQPMKKYSGGFLACVKPGSTIKLQDIGWAKIVEPGDVVINPKTGQPITIPGTVLGR